VGMDEVKSIKEIIDTVVQGDCLTILRDWPDECVDCVVTSPPYWGLRDYGTASWEGGDAECDHLNGPLASPQSTLEGYTGSHVKLATGGMPFADTCGKCGARRIDSQLGLEKTPEEFVAKLIEVFREVRRVLKKTGTCWVNLGDSYAQGLGMARGQAYERHAKVKSGMWKGTRLEKRDIGNSGQIKSSPGLKPKDLVGMPWRVALALQADGWWLRQDIIWAKPNPMPESCKDRCTKAHEYLFLLTKAAKYYFDWAAIAEPCVESNAARPRMGQGPNTQYEQKRSDTGVGFGHGTDNETRGRDRVKRDLGQKLSEAPPEVRASASARFGRGAGWRDEQKRRAQDIAGSYETLGSIQHGQSNAGTRTKRFGDDPEIRNRRSVWTIPTQAYPEAHFATFPEKLVEPCILSGCPEGSLVLDPFMGSGTVGQVAYEHRRHYVGCELNPEYVEQARKRIGRQKHKYELLELTDA